MRKDARVNGHSKVTSILLRRLHIKKLRNVRRTHRITAPSTSVEWGIFAVLRDGVSFVTLSLRPIEAV